jgi:hypothetical protein
VRMAASTARELYSHYRAAWSPITRLFIVHGSDHMHVTTPSKVSGEELMNSGATRAPLCRANVLRRLILISGS